MNQATLAPDELMVLPSDQDASGRTLGVEELEMLRQVIDSGTLTSTKGNFVKRFEERFARLFGVKHAFACASGTAAIHCAIAALDLEPGDEIITTSITDMGALTPILYQGAIPVFCDVDPRTCNVTARAIEKRKKSYAFPWQLATIARLGLLLPIPVYDFIAARNNFRE